MRPFYLTFLLFFTFLFTGCVEECEDAPGLNRVPLVFFLEDSATGENLIVKEPNENPKSVQVDSIKFYNENFIEYDEDDIYRVFYKDLGGYLIGPYFLTYVEDPYQPDSTTFFMYLNAQDTDTISIAYDFAHGDSECTWTTVNYNFYFNGELQQPSDGPLYSGLYFIEK